MRVLIVEDEAALGEVFSDFVVELGHEPIVAGSAEAALEKLLSERPDAVLLDIALPGMSGVDFLRLEPVRRAGLPVVVVSGAATESQARQCLQLGALDFIAKPVALDRLNSILTYMALYVAPRATDEGGRRAERRPTPRARVEFPVRIVRGKGRAWNGTCIELSGTGMKARLGAVLRRGSAVTLAFTPPDGGPPIKVVSLAIRTDRDGTAFWFLDLLGPEAERLAALAQRLGGPSSRTS